MRVTVPNLGMMLADAMKGECVSLGKLHYRMETSRNVNWMYD